MPPLEVWIKIENYYPLWTGIEREFIKNKGVIYDATVTDILKWDDKNKHTENEDNYTGGQIEIYIHPKQMSKFKVEETIRIFLTDYGMTERYHILIRKKNYHAKYDNNDVEDMTIAEVRKHWVKPEQEDKNSSSKKQQRTKKSYTISEKKVKINF